MAAIFPPSGKPPSPAICNGFTPEHRVIGEGPLYAPADCTSVLTDCTFNAIVSEILAAVDALGVPYNAGRVNNLGAALASTFDEVNRRIDTKVNRSGDTMEGPLILLRDPQQPLEAATRRFVVDQDAALNTALRAYADSLAAAVTAAWQAANALMDEKKINRSGDTMQGPLILARAPQEPMEAVTKLYVDEMTHIEEAPMDGRVYGRCNGQWVPVSLISLDDGEY